MTTPQKQNPTGRKTVRVLLWLQGLIFIVAGLGKALPFDLVGGVGGVGAQLELAAKANAGTYIYPATAWFAEHVLLSSVLSGVPMVASGWVQIVNLSPRMVLIASLGQIVMMVCFVAIFHRMVPGIIGLDALLIGVSAYIAFDAQRRC